MSWALVLHVLIVTGFSLRILLREYLSPPARLAWFIVLIAVPYVGAVGYFLFGEADLGRKARQASAEIHESLRQRAEFVFRETAPIRSMINALWLPAFSYAASINGFPPTQGNRATLLPDGEATCESMVADIDEATDHVHVLNYIWLEDRTGTAIAEALIRATQRGVVCRAIADGLGSRALIGSALWRRMQEAGVRLAVALPLNRPLRTILTSRIDVRNHRKITVIDGRETYCGSRNVADPEFRPKAKFAPWVDIMVRFEGPVVAQNQLLFASDWRRATGEVLGPFQPLHGPDRPGFAAQVFGDGPTERHGATSQFFATAIACAHQKLTLSTPYFVPDTTVLDALISAGHRGVSVTLIFPKMNDSSFVAAASRSYYRRLLEAGCIIYEFTGGLLHAKTLTIDDGLCLIGSSNLDLRSFALNYENNILVQDQELTCNIARRQAEYMTQSDTVLLSDVLAWPFYKRIWHNVVATAGPIL